MAVMPTKYAVRVFHRYPDGRLVSPIVGNIDIDKSAAELGKEFVQDKPRSQYEDEDTFEIINHPRYFKNGILGPDGYKYTKDRTHTGLSIIGMDDPEYSLFYEGSPIARAYMLGRFIKDGLDPDGHDIVDAMPGYSMMRGVKNRDMFNRTLLSSESLLDVLKRTGYDKTKAYETLRKSIKAGGKHDNGNRLPIYIPKEEHDRAAELADEGVIGLIPDNFKSSLDRFMARINEYADYTDSKGYYDEDDPNSGWDEKTIGHRSPFIVTVPEDALLKSGDIYYNGKDTPAIRDNEHELITSRLTPVRELPNFKAAYDKYRQLREDGAKDTDAFYDTMELEPDEVLSDAEKKDIYRSMARQYNNRRRLGNITAALTTGDNRWR